MYVLMTVSFVLEAVMYIFILSFFNQKQNFAKSFRPLKCKKLKLHFGKPHFLQMFVFFRLCEFFSFVVYFLYFIGFAVFNKWQVR